MEDTCRILGDVLFPVSKLVPNVYFRVGGR